MEDIDPLILEFNQFIEQGVTLIISHPHTWDEKISCPGPEDYLV